MSPRVVKEYDERYMEFVETAGSLFFSKGYEKTSVQQIIEAVGVAKGTFYHYFGSKKDLLNALVAHMHQDALNTVQPILHDKSLNAIEKIERYFAGVEVWKADNKALLLDTLRVIYRDENILLRTRMKQESLAMGIPILAGLLREGTEAGTLDVEHPEETAEIIVSMAQALSDASVAAILSDDHRAETIEQLERKIYAYNRSVARVLKLPPDGIRLVSPASLQVWLSD